MIASLPQIRSGVAGVVTEIDPTAMKAIRSLKSFQSEMVGAAVVKRIEKTGDLVRSSMHRRPHGYRDTTKHA